jgi:predicted AAA+ superfamily ATPase
MIERVIVEFVGIYKKAFPVLAVTGARQCGKTTLLKKYFSDYAYYNLEDIETRRLFESAPESFINFKNSRVIIDEVQRLPELLPLIQAVVDVQKKMGSYIVSGSDNLLLSAKISQSLAGRAAYIALPTLTNAELDSTKFQKMKLRDKIFTGCYPAIYDRRLKPAMYYNEYISTYIERDVRQIKNISNLNLFREFIRLLAGRIGQPFNASSLSNDVGVNAKTVKEWLSVLEASYIIFLLPPYFRNIGKQVTKMPKIYFYDTGLLCRLLGLSDAKELETHYLIGSIFENFVIADIQKEMMNRKSTDLLYFFREKNGNEVDLLIKRGTSFIPIEIKKAGTFSSDFLKGLNYWKRITDDSSDAAVKNKTPIIIYTGESEIAGGSFKLIGWRYANGALFASRKKRGARKN